MLLVPWITSCRLSPSRPVEGSGPPPPLELQVNALLQAVHGRRVALLTNHTGVDSRLEAIADRIADDQATTLVAFFAPEHGLRGDRQAGEPVDSYPDPRTGTPVYSLYGRTHAPTDAQLCGVDVLIFDMQDVGTRFYTREWLMTYAMEAAARNGLRFIVFDRPNPIGADRVEGPPIRTDAGLVGRVWPGQPFGVPTRHGMTIGELARLVNEEWMNPKVNLQVIPIPGYTRNQTFEDTGYPWVLPSPNMPTLDTAHVYPGMAVFEGVNLSEGRGTTKPFELIGAPFVDGVALARDLNALGLPGVRFRATWFTPSFDDYAGERCGGIQVHVTDRQVFEPVRTALHVLQTVVRAYPDQVEITPYARKLMGIPDLAERIRTEPIDAFIAEWQADLEAFKSLRENYLLYPASSQVRR